MSLHFSRDTKVYLEHTGRFWRIPVLDGFSFSQATNASEITLSEMTSTAGKTRRARQMFNDSYAPAEWSFQSYMRPNTGLPVEDALWASFFTDADWDSATKTWSSGVISGSATALGMTISSSASNIPELQTFDLYFIMGASKAPSSDDFTTGSSIQVYKIENCIPNEASIDFDVDGIATINWSGFGKIITEAASMSTNNGALLEARNITSTDNYIRNRLTRLSLSSDDTTNFLDNYKITLTGGNITFTNNITYLTPETLGRINQPLEHITGTRAINGNFTCYLGGGNDESAELFEDLIEATSVITNSFKLNFDIGGASGPKCSINLPKCHLEVPTHGIEDVITLDTNFHALPTDIDSANEVTITYTGA